MALGILQQSSVQSLAGATSANLSFSGNRTAGSEIVVLVASRNSADSGAGTTANDGSAFSIAKEQTSFSSIAAGIHYRENVAGGVNPTIVVTVNAGDGAHTTGYAMAVEVGDVASSSSVDQTVGASGSSTTPASGSTGALAQAAEIVFSVMAAQDNVDGTAMTNPPNSGYTTLAHDYTQFNGLIYSFAYKIVAATTAVSSDTGTSGSSLTWDYAVATFKQKAASAIAAIVSLLNNQRASQ